MELSKYGRKRLLLCVCHLTKTKRMKLGFNVVALETGGSSQLQLDASDPWKNAVLLCTLNKNCAHRPVAQTWTGHTPCMCPCFSCQ